MKDGVQRRGAGREEVELNVSSKFDSAEQLNQPFTKSKCSPTFPEFESIDRRKKGGKIKKDKKDVLTET